MSGRHSPTSEHQALVHCQTLCAGFHRVRRKKVDVGRGGMYGEWNGGGILREIRHAQLGQFRQLVDGTWTWGRDCWTLQKAPHRAENGGA